jgi:hypothetical protein
MRLVNHPAESIGPMGLLNRILFLPPLILETADAPVLRWMLNDNRILEALCHQFGPGGSGISFAVKTKGQALAASLADFFPAPHFVFRQSVDLQRELSQVARA